MKLWFLLLLFLSSAHAYKILVYSNLFGHSHVKFMGSIADTITDAGHDVTVLMPVIDGAQKNQTCLKTTKKTIFIDEDENNTLFAQMKKMMENLWDMDMTNPLVSLMFAPSMAQLFTTPCKKVLSNNALLERLRAENFDLGVAEPFDTCAYALFEAINIRAHVAVLSCSRLDHVSEAIGQPIVPSYVPATQSIYSDKMTTWQRFMNTLYFISGTYVFGYVGDQDFKLAKEVLGIQRSWRDIVPEASFIFTNHIPLLDFPAPTFDKIIPIGGISVKTIKKTVKLDEKWDKILSIRKKNVFLSFGSNAKSIFMPEEYKKSLLKVFESMSDTTFIWKYEDENDKLAAHLDNVYLGSWLPQNELLADSRLTLFVTHGGLASTTELALMGKPCVMVPLFADQTRNAHMLKRHGGAIVLEKGDLGNWEKIRDSIQTIINNQSYRKNAEHLADMLNNQPTNPKETLVKHVEFAAKFGKLPNMDPFGRHQSFVEYFLLDIIAIFILISLISTYISYRVFVWVCCSKKSKKSKSE